jgi:deoxyinosine 3'endonuclease (endonuclease V)
MEKLLDSVKAEIHEQWKVEQKELHNKLIKENERKLNFMNVRYIGGMDISFVKGTNLACAALVVLDYPGLSVVYEDYAMVELTQPYIAGFLAFREVQPLVTLWKTLKNTKAEFLPQVVMLDGNGILHPREMGVASHFGVLVNVPTIGVAKNLLYVDGLKRDTVKPLCQSKLKVAGDHVELVGDSGKIWGAAMRGTNEAKNWVYVSIGHLVDLQFALDTVRMCCKTKIPEPIRQADLRSREQVREWVKNHTVKKCCTLTG